MAASFAIVLVVARLVHVDGRLAVLIAVGSAVCGNTAIVATAPVIGARAREVAYAVATITLFGTLAVFLYPTIGRAVGLSPTSFGLWAGVAVHDTSQVIATGAAFGPEALDVATVVKLIRNALMAPLLFLIAAVWAARADSNPASGPRALGRRGIRRAVPLFVLGFLALAALRTDRLDRRARGDRARHGRAQPDPGRARGRRHVDPRRRAARDELAADRGRFHRRLAVGLGSLVAIIDARPGRPPIAALGGRETACPAILPRWRSRRWHRCRADRPPTRGRSSPRGSDGSTTARRSRSRSASSPSVPRDGSATSCCCSSIRPVLTLGRTADPAHIRADAATLGARGIEVIRVERGGEVTYHGPGQLVAYPILALSARGLLVRPLVRALEAALVATCAAYGVAAARRDGHPGCWCDPDGPDPRKIGALGLRVERGVSYHGIALNVTVDLADFDLIDPCGMPGVVSTSIAAERGEATAAAHDRIGRARRRHLRRRASPPDSARRSTGI